MKQLHFHRYAEAEKDFKEALAIDPSREESKKALINTNYEWDPDCLFGLHSGDFSAHRFRSN